MRYRCLLSGACPDLSWNSKELWRLGKVAMMLAKCFDGAEGSIVCRWAWRGDLRMIPMASFLIADRKFCCSADLLVVLRGKWGKEYLSSLLPTASTKVLATWKQLPNTVCSLCYWRRYLAGTSAPFWIARFRWWPVLPSGVRSP